jgi:glycosyltransferase involved in cell wall biosynthesis
VDRRVLHIRSSGGILGAENVIIELSKHSPEFGYKPIIGAIKNICDPDPEFLDIARDYNIKTVIFKTRRSFDPILTRTMQRFINDHSVDLLHCHGYKEDFYGILTQVRIPKVATNHLWKRSTLRSKLYSLIDIFLLQFFNQVVGVSDEIVEEMRHYMIHLPIKIANGVDIDKFQVSMRSMELYSEFGIHPGDIVLGMVSSLTPEKGHMLAIQALRDIVKEFPNVRLLIIGEGALRPAIESQIYKNSLSNQISLLGKRLDIPDLLSIIDVFLLPSYKEGLPMALLEAMAAGKAVIATRVGENGNVITHKHTGLLIDPGDTNQLKMAIIELIHCRDLIQSLGNNARSEIEAKYSSRNMARSYCEIYTMVIDNYARSVARNA